MNAGRCRTNRIALVGAAVILAAIAGIALFERYRAAPRTDEPDAAPLRLKWTYTAPRPGAAVAAPLVTDDAIYLAAIHARGFSLSGTVYALDGTGQPRWSFDADGTMLPTASSPTLADGRLYFGEGMHANFSCRLFCLDAATGRQFWNFPTTDHIEGGPVVADGLVIIPAGNDGLYAIDAITGKQKWNFRGDLHIDSTPLVRSGRVYVGSGPSKKFATSAVVCVELATGRPMWRTPMHLPAWAPVAATGDRLFVGLGNGRLTKGAEPSEKPAGGLACLDPDSGKLLWSISAADAVFGKPAIVGKDRIAFGSRDGDLYFYDFDGQSLSRLPLGAPIIASPLFDRDRTFAATVSGLLVRTGLGGAEQWRFELPRGSHVYAPLRVHGNELYVAAETRLPEAAYGTVSLSCYEIQR
ncbi:MAG TPA: PQQ-binding-like beta-propeller repeat protein [Gemmataceae bacterium]|jgi:outer membrane protein assembly factor BamB